MNKMSEYYSETENKEFKELNERSDDKSIKLGKDSKFKELNTITKEGGS